MTYIKDEAGRNWPAYLISGQYISEGTSDIADQLMRAIKKIFFMCLANGPIKISGRTISQADNRYSEDLVASSLKHLIKRLGEYIKEDPQPHFSVKDGGNWKLYKISMDTVNDVIVLSVFECT